jgi:hypothetical protein
MTNALKLERVRQLLHGWYRNQTGAEPPLREAILVRDGFYCGRRFILGDYQATWFVEEDEVKIASRNGTIVERFLISRPPDNQRTTFPAARAA